MLVGGGQEGGKCYNNGYLWYKCKVSNVPLFAAQSTFWRHHDALRAWFTYQTIVNTPHR